MKPLTPADHQLLQPFYTAMFTKPVKNDSERTGLGWRTQTTATTEELTFADWQKLIAFNLDGTFLFSHAVIPVMKRRRSGKIVNLASIAGRGLSSNSSSASMIVFREKCIISRRTDG